MPTPAENARAALARVADFGPPESQDWPAVNAQVAIAEATLALAEQQRAANLIAMALGNAHLIRTQQLPADTDIPAAIRRIDRMMDEARTIVGLAKEDDDAPTQP